MLAADRKWGQYNSQRWNRQEPRKAHTLCRCSCRQKWITLTCYCSVFQNPGETGHHPFKSLALQENRHARKKGVLHAKTVWYASQAEISELLFGDFSLTDRHIFSRTPPAEVVHEPKKRLLCALV
jgi:hypothetical protein